MKNENRWKQRFANFEKAYTQLGIVLGKDTANDATYRSALIQTFEFVFELAWKTMNDKLDYEGFIVKNPRDTIQQAFQAEYIIDNESWIKALNTRNILSHSYNEAASIQAEKDIRTMYTKLFDELYVYLKKSL